MTDYRPVIRNQADLERTWRHLMGPFGYSRRSVWWMLIRPDGQPIPHLAELDDADAVPDAEERAAFASFLADLAGSLEPDLRVAFLISRPGHDPANATDTGWAEALYDIARLAGLPAEVVHLANDAAVVPLPWDALAAS